MIDPPFVGADPVSPRRALIMLAILVIGLGAGAAFAWLLHLLNPVFHDAADLRESTGLPVLGGVSMTWIQRHRRERKLEVLSFATAFGLLLVVFVVAFILRDTGGEMLRTLLSGGAA
jgi:4-amino-4-deoxy-L-arabinose transferase-like glycosyltransferase